MAAGQGRAFMVRDAPSGAPHHEDRKLRLFRHDGQITSVLRNRVKPRAQKYSAFQKTQISGINRLSRARLRDASRSSRNVGRRMRWTLRASGGIAPPDEIALGVRQSRVVLAPRP